MTPAIDNASRAVIAVAVAVRALNDAVAADGSTPALAAALAACKCALELADVGLDAAIAADSLDWSPDALAAAGG